MSECKECLRLRGLIEALPLAKDVEVFAYPVDPHWDVSSTNLLIRCWSLATANTLAALLRARQETP